MAIRIGGYDVSGLFDMSTAEQVTALGGPGRGGGTRRLAEEWARESGKNVKTEMRAVQRALKENRRHPAKRPEVTRAPIVRRIIADNLRNAQRINVTGKVRVASVSKQREQGDRTIGNLSEERVRQGVDMFGDAANMLEAGNMESFADYFGEGLMEAYGAPGLGVVSYEGDVDVH